jgi:plastocyanin
VRRPRALLVGLAVLAVAAAGCGGGDGGSDSGYEEPSGPAQETLTVDAGNLFFDPTTLELPAGVNAIKLQGKGGTHDLVFDDDKVPGFRLDVNGDGSSDELKLDVKPGKYTYYCSIPGHRASMEGTLTVK